MSINTGEGIFQAVNTGAGSGDMTQAVYDPQGINGDAFLRSNHNGVFAPSLTTTVTDPAQDAATSTAIVDGNDGIVITLTATSNSQSLGNPTDTTAGKQFFVINNDSSVDEIVVHGQTLQIGEAASFTWDGTEWGADPVRNSILASQSSILMSGCTPSINADTTLFDISSGVYCIVDAHSVANKIMVRVVNYAGSTGNSVTNLATQDITALALDKDENIIQSATAFEREEIRQYAVIGSLGHPTRVAITTINRFTATPSVNIGSALYDLSNVFGTVNYNGSFKASANGANLNVDLSAGTQFRMGQDPDDLDDQNFIDRAGQPALTWIYGWTTTDGGGFKNLLGQTAIIPGSYDDGTAVQADALPQGSVGNNQFSIHHIYYEASSNIAAVQFGRNTYSSIADAQAGQDSDLGTSENPSLGGFIKVAYIIVKGNATDLSDSSQAQFNAAPFIRGSIGGSSVAGTTTLQRAYDNSAQPQITTSASNGAMQVQRGSAADTDNIYELLNGAGTVTAAIDGNGVIKTNTITALSGADTTVNQNLIVTGDLTVNGTTTTINTDTLEVEDKNIEMGVVTTPTDVTADGGGITLKGSTDKTIIWDNANDNWTSSEHWNLVTGKEYKVNNVSVLNATTLGSSVVNSSLTTVGTLQNFASTGIDDNATSTQLTVADSAISIANNVDFSVNSGTLFVDASANEVGVGLIAPEAQLHVSRSGGPGSDLIVSNENANGEILRIRAKLTADTNYHVGEISILRTGDGSGDMVLSTGTGGIATEQVRIKSNGVVNMGNLPTSSAGLSSGDLWNNSGVINIV